MEKIRRQYYTAIRLVVISSIIVFAISMAIIAYPDIITLRYVQGVCILFYIVIGIIAICKYRKYTRLLRDYWWW